MNDPNQTTSKFLSLVLRHKPESIGLTLDHNGWAMVDELIVKAVAHHVYLTKDLLQEIVETNNKKRFIFSEDGQQIRASQGHSVAVDLQLIEVIPPDTLYHGTAIRNIELIRVQGLVEGKRHHVHLSGDTGTAIQVGKRHGKPIVISIDAKSMHRDGYKFYQSENGVWLVDHVPANYLHYK